MARRYIIITETSSSQLELRVNYYLEQGYKPLGGVSISKTEWALDGDTYPNITYAQAMLNEGA